MCYQVIALILPLVTVPYISRVLESEAIGINSYTNTIMSYFVLLANIGLTVYGSRAISYTRDSLYERSKTFWEIIYIKIFMATMSYLSLLIFIRAYNCYSIYLLWQSIQILAAGLDISWLFTGLEDFKKTVTRNIIVKLLSASLVFTLVKNKGDLILYIIILATSTLLGNLTLWPYLKKIIIRVPYKELHIISHIKPILMLFFPQLVTQLFITLNKLMLGNLSTISQTGYFDNADKIMRMLLTAITAVGTVIFPRLVNTFKQKDGQKVAEYLKLSFDVVSFISIPMTFGLISTSGPFSDVYFGDSFKGINITLAILAIELIFMGWSTVFGYQYLIAIDKVKGLTISTIVGTVVLFIFSLILIPSYGSAGSAIAAVLGELVIATIQLFFVNKHIKLRQICKDFYKFLLAGLIMLGVCLLLNHFVANDIFNILSQVILGGSVYLACIVIFRPKLVNINKIKQYFMR